MANEKSSLDDLKKYQVNVVHSTGKKYETEYIISSPILFDKHDRLHQPNISE